jgi:Fission yeast centromere protein N-terminal domain
MAPLSAASSSLSAPKNKRKAITDTERLMIRKRQKEYPSKQIDLAKWFYNETGHAIDQAQVSKILSSTYDFLDGLDLKKDKKALNSKRTSAGDWPDLEAALFEWQQRIQKN